jgi:5'-nucleotidase
VLYALGTLYLSPELVISGINEGQNMGSVVGISGTVGAARRARLNYVPAIASSQGTGPNFATSGIADGVAATLALLEEWRLGRTVNTSNSVLNINIPTCVSGLFPRGTVQTEVSTGSANYTVQDCASAAAIGTVLHDIDAFNKGFIGIADVGKIQPPNWP